MNATDPLAQLHDIILPEPISTLPIAIGWWILLFLSISLIIGAVWYYRQQRQRNAGKRAALKLLDQISHQYKQQTDPKHLLNALSQLLRRTAIAYFPKNKVAGLTGKAWLNFLNQHSETPFDHNLIQAPYQTDIKLSPDDCQNLIARTRRWIQTTPNPKL